MEAQAAVSGINRRRFLKKAGLSSVALASLPGLSAALARPVLAAGQTGFHVVAASAGGGDLVILAGDGTLTPAEVVGDGSFAHFNATSFALKASGTWKANKLNSFVFNGAIGAIASGIADMEITLSPVGKAPVRADLRVVCNLPTLPPTGQDEGFVLKVDGLTFTQTGIGASLFTTMVEEAA